MKLRYEQIEYCRQAIARTVGGCGSEIKVSLLLSRRWEGPASESRPIAGCIGTAMAAWLNLQVVLMALMVSVIDSIL